MAGCAESSIVNPEAVQPETDLAEFFHGVISALYDLKNRHILDKVKLALIDMSRLQSEADNFRKKTPFSFKPPQMRCAYLYAYSVLMSIMVYHEFSNLLKRSRMFLLPTCRTGSLKICCLGGGPGIEVVAIYKSICDIILESYLTNPSLLLEIHVTVIDKLPHWKKEESAIKSVNDSSNVFNSERIILHSDFMKADVLKPFEENLKAKIKEADIVTVVKQAVPIQENSPESCNRELLLMENIIESMREDSCLFMLDKAGSKVFFTIAKFLIDKPQSSMEITMKNEYLLDVSTAEKFDDMMRLKKDLNHLSFTPAMKGEVSACMWVKNISNFSDNYNLADENNEVKCQEPHVSLEADASSATNSSSDLQTSNGDVLATTEFATTTEPQKSKRAMKKEMKRKPKKKS